MQFSVHELSVASGLSMIALPTGLALPTPALARDADEGASYSDQRVTTRVVPPVN